MPTTGEYKSIDIRWLKKHENLTPGTWASLSWSCGGEPNGNIGFRMEEDTMTLTYKHRSRNDDPWEDIEQVIRFDRTPCYFGGFRKWFLCPKCWRRVALLYLGGKRFFCRHCYNLAYNSQQEGEIDRMMRKTSKILKRLGVEDIESILFKPKGMHQRTFDRLRWEADEADGRAWGIMGRRFGIV